MGEEENTDIIKITIPLRPECMPGTNRCMGSQGTKVLTVDRKGYTGPIHVYVYIYMYICIYVHTHAHTHTHIYIYIHI